MSQALKILAALQQHGTSTYQQLQPRVGIPMNPLRWAVNDLKTRQLVMQCEDSTSNAIAWKITAAGTGFLQANGPKAAPASKPLADKKYKSKPGPKKASAPSEKGVDTPAAGGACNSGSSASDSLVETATTSTEGTVVVETRAGSEGPEAASAAAEPVVSDEKDTTPDAGPLIACIGIRGSLTIANKQGEFQLPPHQVRQLGDFLLNTYEVWGQK